MMTFNDLFRQPTRKVKGKSSPDRRRELFPGVVEQHRLLHLWTAEQVVPERGHRLLVGVATWAVRDMNTLDLVAQLPDNGVRVDVFDVDAFSATDLAGFFPGLALLQTPFVGYWVAGKLVRVANGVEARELMSSVRGLNLAELIEDADTYAGDTGTPEE